VPNRMAKRNKPPELKAGEAYSIGYAGLDHTVRATPALESKRRGGEGKQAHTEEEVGVVSCCS